MIYGHRKKRMSRMKPKANRNWLDSKCIGQPQKCNCLDMPNPIGSLKKLVFKFSQYFRPPPEYLFNEEERRKWEEKNLELDEFERPKFIPQRYNSLREVPFFENFYEERLERCMDLHLAPRQRKMRVKKLIKMKNKHLN
jgi:ribosome biogenesis protein ERB1